MNIKYAALVLLFSPFVFVASPVYAEQASLSLSPSTGTFKKGCQFTVDLKINTGGGQTDGTDAYLKYDTAKLSINSSAIAAGTFYPDSPGNSVDESTGKISVSGLSNLSNTVSGAGTLATLTFTVKENAAEGSTKVTFDFDPNDKANTTDSNVVVRDMGDILSAVTDGNYTIGSGTGCGAAAVTTGTGGVSTPSGSVNDGSFAKDPSFGQKKALPNSGTQELTYTIAIMGATLTVLGLLGLVLL